MKQTQTIVVVRHPQKDGDNITPTGAMQMFAMALLLGLRFVFERLVVSGANRTWQAVSVASAALNLRLTPEVNAGFLFEDTLAKVFGANRQACLDEIPVVKKAGGFVAQAFEVSEYARRACDLVSETITALAADMAERGQTTALAVSHSPWFECAGIPETTPYGLGEADAIVFTVVEGVITASELIAAPIPGKTN